jgi:hypothetical protein
MANDPRAANCQKFAVDAAGRVVGVELAVLQLPKAQYELIRVELIDENQAQGNTVASCYVLDKEGLQVGTPVSLAWPWPDLTDYALPGNPNNQHPITNRYFPPEVGPLALCIRVNGVIISDIVGGLGLPGGHHVSFRATWRERSAPGNPDPEPPDDPPDNTFLGLWLRAVEAQERMAAALERLAGHLGA